jgi:hypothetical protein
MDIPTITGSRIDGGNKNEPIPTTRTSHSPVAEAVVVIKIRQWDTLATT